MTSRYRIGLSGLLILSILIAGREITDELSNENFSGVVFAKAGKVGKGAKSAELPRIQLDTTFVHPKGAAINVRVGENFQAALDRAQPGDEIVLEAGSVFTGNFVLGARPGAGWITVRTSNMSGITPPDIRINPSQASAMPKLVSPNSLPVLSTAPSAHHFRFVGVEFTTVSTASGSIVSLGDGGRAQNSTGLVPHDLIIDRCYIHGNATGSLRRGIALNSASTAVIDSYISECHEAGADAQAICGWNGPGPYKIVNNYLEGSGENFMLGGGDPSIVGLVPSDIEFRRNHCRKPLRWKAGDAGYAGSHWTVKNLFELKNARRVLVEGNLFENCWVDGQTGFAIVLKSVNQDGGGGWCVTEDVTFRKNIVRHTAAGMSLLGRENANTADYTKRIVISNNLFEDIGGSAYGGVGRLFEIASGPAVSGGEAVGPGDVQIDHNTAFQTQHIILASSYDESTGKYGVKRGFVFTNNIVMHNEYGVFGDNGGGIGNPALNRYFPSAVFKKNTIVGGPVLLYPSGNLFPVSIGDVGFVDFSSGNYRLLDTSQGRNAGTDGLDIGANLDAIEAAMGSAGSPPGAAPSPEAVIWAADISPSMIFGSWSKSFEASAAGQVVVRDVDAGAAKLVTPLASPANYFDVTFVAQANTPYRLWMRGRAANDSGYNDSVHVQFSGSVDAAGAPVYRIGTSSSTIVNLEEYAACGLHSWAWQDNGWGPGVMGPLIYFQASGPQTIRVQTREDGISIDQIVLSAQRYLNSSPGALRDDTVIVPRTQ